MHRRTFLEIVGAATTLEIERPATVESGTEPMAGERAVDVRSLANTLPAARDLSVESGVAFSVTRLDEESVTTTADLVADARAYGTVFSGPTATDVAFDVRRGDRFGERLAEEGYDPIDRPDGWVLFSRRQRTRHRIVAVGDSAAVVGVGPVRDAVVNDVRAAMAAVDATSEALDGAKSDRRAVLDRLGQGTHVTVDTSPDPRRTAESVVATGRRYDVHGDTTAVRGVLLFDSRQNARRAGDDVFEFGRQLPDMDENERSVALDGRAVVRETVVPTEPF